MENKLEELLSENKARLAKKHLVDDLAKGHKIDISQNGFIDFHISKKVHKKVYERIRSDNIKTLTFPNDKENLISKIHFIFDYFKNYEDKKVLFYPSAFRSSNQPYLEYPIAITLPLSECHQIIMELILGMHDDLIVKSEECNFGFVLSEDEYFNISIEYWDK